MTEEHDNIIIDKVDDTIEKRTSLLEVLLIAAIPGSTLYHTHKGSKKEYSLAAFVDTAKIVGYVNIALHYLHDAPNPF